MANKRVSELAPITATELDFADLLLLSDISAHESKKLQLSDLSSFLLLDGRLTGSLLGTASYALRALSASYAPFVSASYANTSSWALNISTASYALLALSSSYSLSSSYCITASYALTSSVELVYSSAFADFARTSSYLLFTPGVINGTASYALTASFFLGAPQVSASYAATSSWAFNAISASRAISSQNADTASLVPTASFLAFNGVPNGTASYALSAGSIANARTDFGVFTAISQSVSSSQLDLVAVTSPLGDLKRTSFTAHGNVRFPVRSSETIYGFIELFVLDRATGFSSSLDKSPLTSIWSTTLAVDDDGILSVPFSLIGEIPLYGLYEVYVTASNEAYLDITRSVKFKISSENNQLAVTTAEPLQFITYPSNAIMLFSSSLHPGVAYQGSASQVTFSGSVDVTELLVPPNAVNIMQYTWTLINAAKITVDNNSGLTFLGGIPTNCVSMSAANCGLSSIPSLFSGSISYLNVPNNTIVASLSLPPSMSFINVTNNFFVSFPTSLPAGLTALLADGLGITSTPFGVPNTLLTMSFASCTQLSSWLAPAFPTSLQRWNSSGSPFTNLPTVMPSNLIYMDVGSNLLPSTTISNIASGLVANGLNNGHLSIRNNPGSGSAFGITANLATLVTRGWTIVS